MTENTVTPSVTFCITELDIGGAEKAMVRIAIGLQDNGWRVRVISLRNAGAMADPLRAAGIPVKALGCGRFADLRMLWRLGAELRRNPTHLVQCFLHQANIYGRLATRFLCHRGDDGHRPLVVSGIRVADRRRWVILTDRWTRSYSDHYVAVSEHVADTHAELCRLNRDDVTSIPNGVDVPDGLIDAPNPVPHTLLSVGRLTTQKAPLDLLEAFRLLPDELRCQCRLNFVGDGPLAFSLQKVIDRLQLNDRVLLSGHSHKVLQLMRESTVLVLPSRWEGMPNVVLEAMANALPVVATSIDGNRELIDDGTTGWLVPAANPAALAERIASALGDPEGRRSIARQAQAKASQHFSWPSAIERYDQLLRDLLAKEPPDHAAKTQI